MRKKPREIIFSLLLFFLIALTTLFATKTEELYALEIDNNIFIKKVSKSYTNKFCNAIGFGLSKESAMKFSFEENRQVFKKRKEINNINKELLAEEIAISVVEKCGYPIKLSGDDGIKEFKNYYIAEDKE